jgi:hypothetical protein
MVPGDSPVGAVANCFSAVPEHQMRAEEVKGFSLHGHVKVRVWEWRKGWIRGGPEMRESLGSGDEGLRAGIIGGGYVLCKEF